MIAQHALKRLRPSDGGFRHSTPLWREAVLHQKRSVGHVQHHYAGPSIYQEVRCGESMVPVGRRGIEDDRRSCCENSRKKMDLRCPRRFSPFSGSDSEYVANEPRLTGRIFLCCLPDSAPPNHVDRLDTLSPSIAKRFLAHRQPGAAFDGSMVLLYGVVEVFTLTPTTAAPQPALVL